MLWRRGWVAGWLVGWVYVTRRYCIKTAKPILKRLRPSGIAIILVYSDSWADTQFQGKPLQRSTVAPSDPTEKYRDIDAQQLLYTSHPVHNRPKEV